MENTRPFLVAQKEKKTLPILIIDRKGYIGKNLSDKLKEQFLIVLVTGEEIPYHKNIIHISYKKRIPTIPDNTYSHIFVVYSGGEEVLEMLPSLMRKAEMSKGRMFFLTSLHYSSPKLFKRLSHHTYHFLHILLYGEIFDNDLTLGNMVNLFIFQVRKNGQIVIPNDGLGKLYPVYIEDVLVAVIASAFSHETPHRTLFIFPKVPFTEISLARLFQKIDPDIRVDFQKRKVPSFSHFVPGEGYYVFRNYSLEESLKKINLTPESGSRRIPEKQVKPPSPKKKGVFPLRSVLLFLLLVILLPLLLLAVFAGAGVYSLTHAVDMAEEGKFTRAKVYAGVGKNSFAAAYTLGANYVPGDFFATEQKAELVENLTAARVVATVASDLFTSLDAFSNLYHNQPKKDLEKELAKSLADTKNSLLRLEEVRAQGLLPKQAEAKLSEMQFLLTTVENTIDHFPQLLGFDGKKKYLLLFQNNMELRPGGGFIGSYGIVTVDKGKFGKIQIHDVYDADGKLSVHVEPPYALRRFAGVSHSFLRDSNFSVDYTANALASRVILKRATGESVDGVIAVDTNFIKNILEVLGTVRVDEYKVDVTADNFYMLTQKHVEDNFFPGSTQKKDFLRALLTSMLTELSERKNLPFQAFAKAAEKSIKEKHLMITFSDESIQQTLSANRLSGALLDGRRKQGNTILDFLSTFDANIGANKGNYYLKRSISQSVTIAQDGSISETASITFENTSKKDSKFGGEYKNYLRFILPAGTSLTGVRIDDQDTPIIEAFTNPTIYTAPDFVTPSELEIESAQINGKEVIGFFMTVPVESRKKVTIVYTLPQTITTTSPEFTYAMRVFKQPGTIDDPYSLTITYPKQYKLFEGTKGVVDLGGKAVYETNLSEDRDVRVRFMKK